MIKIESEKTLEAKLGREIKKLGGLCIKFLPTYMTGLPDRICLLPGGRIYFIEMKTTKEKAKKKQCLIHRKFKALGFPVLILDTSEKINLFIQTI